MVFREEDPLSGRVGGRFAAAAAAALALAGPALPWLAAPAWAAPAAEGLAGKRPHVVETTFRSVDADIAGQWDFPERTPAPLVLILPGSGRVDRHGLPSGQTDEPERGVYAQLARALLDAGFAVFRFDTAGSGRSSRGRYSTSRATALEAFARAVDHGRVDPDRVFILGHTTGTESIGTIYPRYEEANPVAGVVLLGNRIGETNIARVRAATLIIVSDRYPDDRYQFGRFALEARERSTDPELETRLVTIAGAEPSLVAESDDGFEVSDRLDPRAIEAVLAWLGEQRARGEGV